MLAMDRWAGRVAVVTGASAGIGAAIAGDLVLAGMRVVGLARREDKLEELAAALSSGPGEFRAVRCDVSDMADVQRAFRRVDESVGGVSVLVNNAGLMLPHRIQDMTNKDMAAVVNTNILGLTACCREAINSMKKHGITDGHIVNINSVLGHIVPVFENPEFNVAMYAGSKHAVTAICQGLRAEMKNLRGFRIKVTSVSPGPVLTDMFGDDLRDSIPKEDVERLLKADDVSRTVCFALACPPDVEMVELTMQATGHLT